ncbi:MAG TPA: methyltransferase domain-containing protein [Stellaceae bacterium]|jgi:ubiquinone/menaquinone biosynthesis C-methylase UbiE|nr:methyltransferase domain-containing protein [Stellaceae bacterium]
MLGLSRFTITASNWNPVTHYLDTRVATSYDRIRFSSLAGRAFVAIERRVLRQAFARLPRGVTVLDLPCGTGRLAEVLLEDGYDIVGGDISDEMLAVARRRLERFGKRFTSKVLDARRLDGEAEQFDIALCARVLMHFPLAEQKEFLKGVANASRRFVVITQSYNSPYQQFRRHTRKILKGQNPSRHPISEAEIGELLAAAGLREVWRRHLAPPISETFILVAEKIVPATTGAAK